MSFVIGLIVGMLIGSATIIAYAWLTGEVGSRRKATPRITAPIEEKVSRLYRTAPHPNTDAEPTVVRRAMFRQKRNRNGD